MYLLHTLYIRSKLYGVQVLQEVQEGYERFGELYEDVQWVQEVSLAYLLLLEIHLHPLCVPLSVPLPISYVH